MKLTLSSLALALIAQAGIAQCTITAPGTLELAPPIDGWSAIQSLGFTFTLNGTAYTDFYYSDHGMIALTNGGTPGVPPGGGQTWTPGTAGLSTFGADVICAYWGDHTVGGGGIYIDNTSGNHCTITWLDSEPYLNYVAGAFTAQLTLSQSGNIKVCLDGRCNNTSSTFGPVETIIGVQQNGSPVPASSDLSTGTTVTVDPSCFEIFVGPGPQFTNTPDPLFDLGDTEITFIQTTPGWVVLTAPLSCASTTSVGTGCAGLVLTSNSAPVIGATWDLELSGISQPVLPSFIAFGNSTPAAPVGLLFPTLFGATCNAYMDGALGLVDIGTSATGTASLALSIPSSAVLKGFTVTGQGFGFDPSFLFALSNAEQGEFGY